METVAPFDLPHPRAIRGPRTVIFSELKQLECDHWRPEDVGTVDSRGYIISSEPGIAYSNGSIYLRDEEQARKAAHHGWRIVSRTMAGVVLVER